MHALLLTYGLLDATPGQYAELSEELAPAFAAVPGLVSATWLTNRAVNRYGGFYVFDTKSSFDAFVASELYATLSSHPYVRATGTLEFEVDPEPTAATRGPTAASLATKGARP